jgi:hypothetical protein
MGIDRFLCRGGTSSLYPFQDCFSHCVSCGYIASQDIIPTFRRLTIMPDHFLPVEPDQAWNRGRAPGNNSSGDTDMNSKGPLMIGEHMCRVPMKIISHVNN